MLLPMSVACPRFRAERHPRPSSCRPAVGTRASVHRSEGKGGPPVTAPLVLLAAFCGLSITAYTLAWCLVTRWTSRHGVGLPLQRSVAPPPASFTTGLTILKPLCGVDEELEQNLLSFLKLNHEPLQIIFAAASSRDPALILARDLAARFPHRAVQIVVGADPSIANPKVALLESMLPHACHEVVLLSDSNVRLAGDEVAGVLPLFADARVGMVYQPVVAGGERTIPAAIENLHYTEYAAFLTIGVHELVRQHTVNAKGQWARRTALETSGGFAGVRDCGADDYCLAQQVQRAGWRLAPAPVMARVVQRDWSWGSLWSRNLRHAGLRWRICPWAYPLELLFNPIPWTLPLFFSGRPDMAILAVLIVAAKLMMEISATRLLRGQGLAWRLVPVVVVKDFFIFGCWFVAFVPRTAQWRQRTYRLLPGGRIEPVADALATELAVEME